MASFTGVTFTTRIQLVLPEASIGKVLLGPRGVQVVHKGVSRLDGGLPAFRGSALHVVIYHRHRRLHLCHIASLCQLWALWGSGTVERETLMACLAGLNGLIKGRSRPSSQSGLSIHISCYCHRHLHLCLSTT